MLLALGAASSVLDALASLGQSKPSAPKTTGFNQDQPNPFDFSGQPQAPGSSTAGGGSQISPGTMSALLAAQGQSSTAPTTQASTSQSDALKDLFSKLDSNGDGQISKSEFENALGAGGTNTANAGKVFAELDKNGDGSVSLDELSSALTGAKGKGGHHHHHHVADSDTPGAGGPGSTGGSSDPLLQALNGASSTSVTNSDGSTTTSLTYADGSKVTMTSPAAASSAATSSYNFIEQMISREAKSISNAATPSLSISA